MSYVQLLRAPNPGPMTLDGTNTWVITDADEGALVIDPGPAIAISSRRGVRCLRTKAASESC